MCTEWSTGDWGHCRPRLERRRCGRGQQERLVVCRDPNGPRLAEEECHAADRPTSSRPCKIPCRRGSGGGKRGRGRGRPRYKWRAGKWSPCSEPCDRGIKYRNVTCIDNHMGSAVVHYEYCLREGLPRRKSTRRCNVQPCPFRWLSSAWSECSKTCGPGREAREVTCHRVNHLGWVDPLPSPQGCSPSRKPRTSRRCNLGQCDGDFFWKPKPWKPCQAGCGKRGRQRRGISCVNIHRERVARHLCSREHRPRRKQRCWGPPCGFTACSQVQQGLQVTTDGEYTMLVGGKNMTIYCLGMNTSAPREYLTLPAGEEGNFAEMYDKILIQPNTCPHGGERRSTCACVEDHTNHQGYTAFSKIRLNTTSLVVDTYDFAFGRVFSGQRVRYGEAGDCFSMAKCPQGEFSINLAGTFLAVSPVTTWHTKGSLAAHTIRRLDDNQRILGRCGGYCGTCAPDPSAGGLKLEVAQVEGLV